MELSGDDGAIKIVPELELIQPANMITESKVVKSIVECIQMGDVTYEMLYDLTMRNLYNATGLILSLNAFTTILTQLMRNGQVGKQEVTYTYFKLIPQEIKS